MATYPASVDAFTSKNEGPGNYLYAADINGITSAIVAIETILGTTPSGSYATIKAALAALQTSLGTANDDIGDINTGIAGITADVSTLQSDVASLFVAVAGGGSGGTGPTGPTGPAGQPRFVASGPPINVLGALPGDRYLDESTGQIYALFE